MQDKYKTVVKFIRLKGEILALFPDMKNGEWIGSYAHMGQHGDASSAFMHSKAATGQDVDDLYRELTSLGYNLELFQANKSKK